MKIIHFRKIESTNKKAKEMIKKKFVPWTTVVAEEQTAGYGRKGNTWYSPKGGLYFSVILPPLEIKYLEFLTLLVAFSVAKFLKENFSLKSLIKLPNDILIKEKKICGILIENFIFEKKLKASIVGIGLNTNIDKFPEDLRGRATSLKKELKRKIDNKEVLEKILRNLKESLQIIKFKN